MIITSVFSGHRVTNSGPFIELEGSLLYAQNLSTGSYPEPLNQIQFLHHISVTAILVSSFFRCLVLPIVSSLQFSIQYVYILNSVTIRIYIYIQVKVNLTFIGPRILIYFYSRTNQMHQFLKFPNFQNKINLRNWCICLVLLQKGKGKNSP